MLIYYALALLIGSLTGIVTYIFGTLLDYISAFTFQIFPYGLILLPLVGFITIYFRNNFKNEVFQSMPKIFRATKSGDQLSFVILPFQFITTCLSHLAGASVGREGAAVQLGATISNYITSHFEQIDSKSMTRLGMAAGFAGLFGTPLAATMFSLEATKKKHVEFTKITSTLIATTVAAKVSGLLGLEAFHVDVDFTMLDPIQWVLFSLCIVIFALVGHLFAFCHVRLRKAYLNMKLPEYRRIIIFSIIGAILIMSIHQGRYMSFGTNIVSDVFEAPDNVYHLDFLFKMFFTLYFCSLGFQGGEVTPLFTIGSSLGLILAKMLNLPLMVVAAIGYAFTFGNATDAYLTASVLAVEVFGLGILPYVIVALIITKLISNDTHNIYPNLEWE